MVSIKVGCRKIRDCSSPAISATWRCAPGQQHIDDAIADRVGAEMPQSARDQGVRRRGLVRRKSEGIHRASQPKSIAKGCIVPDRYRELSSGLRADVAPQARVLRMGFNVDRDLFVPIGNEDPARTGAGRSAPGRDQAPALGIAEMDGQEFRIGKLTQADKALKRDQIQRGRLGHPAR